MEITLELIAEHFGPEAAVERFSGGWRVTNVAGQIEIRDDKMSNLIGGQEMFMRMVLFAQAAWGGLKVAGPPEFIVACMAHAEALGVYIVPEVPDSFDELMTALGTAMGGVMGFFLGIGIVALVLPEPLSLWLGALVGLWTAWEGAKLFYTELAEEDERKARKRAQPYYNAFPLVHGGQRGAKREIAKREGLL